MEQGNAGRPGVPESVVPASPEVAPPGARGLACDAGPPAEPGARREDQAGPAPCIAAARRAAGGRDADIARLLGITASAVSRWRGIVPPARAIEIERASGGRVTRHQIRPDHFGAVPVAAADAPEGAPEGSPAGSLAGSLVVSSPDAAARAAWPTVPTRDGEGAR